MSAGRRGLLALAWRVAATGGVRAQGANAGPPAAAPGWWLDPHRGVGAGAEDLHLRGRVSLALDGRRHDPRKFDSRGRDASLVARVALEG